MADEVTIRLPRRVFQAIGKRDWSVAVQGEQTLEWVLRCLATECSPTFNEMLMTGARGPSWVESIILNGRTVHLPQDLRLPVKAGDRLYFFEVIAGG